MASSARCSTAFYESESLSTHSPYAAGRREEGSEAWPDYSPIDSGVPVNENAVV